MKRTLLWGIAIAALAAHAAFFVRYTIDDAYITFTCARNFANGEGPVVVPGERVEATSSFLWAMLLAPFEAAGVGSVTASKILGFACAIGALIGALLLLRTLRPAIGDGALAAAGLLIASSSPFVVWSVYGMEHGLVALLLVLSALLFIREIDGKGWLSAIPIVLIEMARPEGFMFVALFVAARLAIAWRAPNRRALLFPWLAVLLLPIAAYEIAGWLYFGGLLPNTVAAKVGGGMAANVKRGLLYLVRGRSAVLTFTFLAGLVLAVPALFGTARTFGFAALREAWSRHRGYAIVVGIVVMQLLFTTMVGGDWMPNGRFISHVAPLVMVALVYTFSVVSDQAASIAATLPGIAPSLRTVGTLALVFIVGFNVHTSERSINGPVGELQASEDRALGGTVEFLNRVGRPGDVVACSDIGRVAYYFKGRVFDWWGLANEEVVRLGQALGHIEPATVLNAKPRFIILYSTRPELTAETTNYGMAEFSKPFLASREFLSTYRRVHSSQFADVRHHVVFERIPGGGFAE